MNSITRAGQAITGLKQDFSAKVLVGFDGFIDEIIHVVDKRENAQKFSRIPTISAYAKRLGAAAGKSTNIELVPVCTKLGGNGPIMANALLSQGLETDYIGTMGDKEVLPLFADFAQKCQHVYSMAAPGYTQALEFDDGKILMGKMNTLDAMNWENLCQRAPAYIENRIKQLDLIAFTNWTMLSGMNSLFKGFDKLMQPGQLVFIDLADPHKRADADIRTCLEILAGMRAKVILGLNESESLHISQVLGISEPILTSRATLIREKLGIYTVVIHPVDCAVAASAAGVWQQAGPYIAKPLLTTGAGDNFNAGFCSALLQGLPTDVALLCAVSTSGYYVKNMTSPCIGELISFIKEHNNIYLK